MARSHAVVATAQASQYLQQLCKHWGHRFTTRFNTASGHIDFGDDQSVELSASADSLTLVILDRDASRLDPFETVVADHLKRFAFREELVFEWTRDKS